jgi:nitrate/TMAO reductase-like tetraheme cytochrome c subunit
MRWLFRKIKGMGSWVTHLPVAIKVALGAVMLILVFGGSYGSYRIYSYTQNDPDFCRSCHTMETAWEKWSTSEHSKVGCHSCHEVSPIGGMQLVADYLLEKPDTNATHAKVSDEACEKCHYSGDPQWVQVESTAGHQSHAEGQNIACQTCHGLRLHRFRPATEICAACHSDKVDGEEHGVKVPQMQELHCTECHPFLRDDSPLRPTRETCLSCHQKITTGGVVFPEEAPMKWDCKECHKPHEAEKPTVDCTSCHQGIRSQGAHSKTTHSQTECQTCHKPHEWKIQSREQCSSCHSDKANHNPGQLCASCHDFKGAIASTGGAAEVQYSDQSAPEGHT